MKKILVTGGTVFVSRYLAEYFSKKGNEVYVLNRGHREQPRGTTLIQADRHQLGDVLSQHRFDVVLDVTAYTGEDVNHLLEALGEFGEYILISSSAVYPETGKQPFQEEEALGSNVYWGAYGRDKIEAEKVLRERCPKAYILRPPYLYGPGNNVYREAFVYECADQDRVFYLPRAGTMKLQFSYIEDVCRLIEKILEVRPARKIYNLGQEEAITVRDWVELCYKAAGKKVRTQEVWADVEQRNYFSFYNYEYQLDITAQTELLPDLTPLEEGLKEAYKWYELHKEDVVPKDYLTYIREHIIPMTDSGVNDTMC